MTPTHDLGGSIVTLQSLGIDRLPRDEQLALAAEILRHVPAPPPSDWLTPEHLADLQRRIEEDDANPEEGVPLEEVMREIRELIQSRVES